MRDYHKEYPFHFTAPAEYHTEEVKDWWGNNRDVMVILNLHRSKYGGLSSIEYGFVNEEDLTLFRIKFG